MGNRAYIVIKTGASEADTISIYGHWAGDNNLEAVKNVLERDGARIGDHSYLTAQIFHEWSVNLNAYEGGTGFGIMAGDGDEEENPTVYVNADNGSYTYQGTEYTEYQKRGI
jgi:hypothetical protein